jgi:phenylpropionate dioxygenase-like ring-hydroxylating dioxygenase large terminal subunit
MNSEVFGLLKANWYILAESSELTSGRPLSRQAFGRGWALFRTKSGKIAILEDRCPHRNVPLSAGRVKGERIACAYHGWEFNARGGCEKVPGLCAEGALRELMNARSLEVCEKDGWIWAFFDDAQKAPPLPESAIQGMSAFRFSRRVNGSLTAILENLLDPMHTHFVHSGLIRKEGARRKIRVQVIREPKSVEARYRGIQERSGWIRRIFGGGIDSTAGRFEWPTTARLSYHMKGPAKGLAKDQTRFRVDVCLTPETENSFAAHTTVFYRMAGIPAWLAKWLLMPFLARAAEQDRAILELQQRNLAAFGEARFSSTPVDLLGSAISEILQIPREIPGENQGKSSSYWVEIEI